MFLPHLTADSFGCKITDQQFMRIDPDLLIFQHIIETFRAMDVGRFFETVFSVKFCFQFGCFKTEMITALSYIFLYRMNTIGKNRFTAKVSQIFTLGVNIQWFK